MRVLTVLALAQAIVYAEPQATPSAVPLYSCSDSSPFRLQCNHPSMASYCGGKGTCCNDDGTMQIADNLHCGANVCTCIHSDACDEVDAISTVSSTVTFRG